MPVWLYAGLWNYQHDYYITCIIHLGLEVRKTVFWGFANNTGADQPAHPRSLISAFVIRFWESIICKLATGEIDWFENRFGVNPEDRFSCDKAHFTPDTGAVTTYPPAAAIHAFGDLEKVFNRVLRDVIWWNLACWETSELVQSMFRDMRSRVSC